MARKPEEFTSFPVSFEEAREAGLTRAVCRHVVDGDTQDFLLDAGWLLYAYETVRLRGIDTPEIYRPKSQAEREHGQEVRAFVERLILNQPCLVQTYKDRTSFGRFEADVWHRASGGDLVVGAVAWARLADTLREAGFEKRASYK